MKTKAKYPDASSPKAEPSACLPCEVPPLCRTGYYTGKLLTARDFSEEQRYHIDKLRLHHMFLHGWGTVCGLRVKPHPHCPDLRIVVEAGLAIDHCGREVRLLEDVELHLPQPIKKPPPPDPCPPDPGPEYPAASPPAPEGHYEHEPPEEETLWVCLRYCEREEQFSPAPFDECACTGTVQKPNCVCESYHLHLSTKEPKFLKEIEEHKHCSCEDCWDLYRDMLDKCKHVDVDCIPLAVIKHFRRGQKVEHHMIDNLTHRPLLPSVHRLDKVVRCILEKLPRCKVTRISEFNWAHGSDMHCHEFMHRFIGHDKGFEIKFDGPVRSEGIHRRSSQALVVHHPESPDQPRRMEIAPADVEILPPTHTPTHIRLRIHEHYARRHLDGNNFELFITLKCNVIVDQHGVPVDGDLLARLQYDGSTYFVGPPTGNGVPGGLFESWILVHSGEGRAEHR
jgi:hypothetical protein